MVAVPYFDFDTWCDDVQWPQQGLPLARCSVAVEDIKFAFNAWCLLRLCMFYGAAHPTVLSPLQSTTPSMDPALRGNATFHAHATVGGVLDRNRLTIGLTPQGPRARNAYTFPWGELRGRDVQLVLGMENGMSDALVQRCDECVYIPQYGSVGSLSMMNALAIAMHHAHTAIRAGGDPGGGPSQADPPYSLHDAAATGHCGSGRPHGQGLLGASDDAVLAALADGRRRSALQLGVLWHNDSADRNIGATVRNANVFNCERVVVLKRRKYSRRGTLGTHHYTQVEHLKTLEEAAPLLDGYELWAVDNPYPWLQDHWADAGPPPPLPLPTVALDDPASLHGAVRAAKDAGRRGIMVVQPEDGATHRPHMWARCDRSVRLVSPSLLAPSQRGMAPGNATAVILERLKHAIRAL